MKGVHLLPHGSWWGRYDTMDGSERSLSRKLREGHGYLSSAHVSGWLGGIREQGDKAGAEALRLVFKKGDRRGRNLVRLWSGQCMQREQQDGMIVDSWEAGEGLREAHLGQSSTVEMGTT